MKTRVPDLTACCFYQTIKASTGVAHSSSFVCSLFKISFNKKLEIKAACVRK